MRLLDRLRIIPTGAADATSSGPTTGRGLIGHDLWTEAGPGSYVGPGSWLRAVWPVDLETDLEIRADVEVDEPVSVSTISRARRYRSELDERGLLRIRLDRSLLDKREETD